MANFTKNKPVELYKNTDYIPINHSKSEYHLSKNRISKKLGSYIRKLYIDENKSIEEISVIVEKSEISINKFLTEKKYL